MSAPRGDRQAFGQPGLPPRWAPGDKDGVGTAYSAASRIWFTIWNGIVTEIYYPTIDRPQTRDLRYLFSDGQTFCHDEADLDTDIEPLGDSLGFMVRGRDREGRYSYEKEIISDPHGSCLLQRTKISASPDMLQKLKVYALCSPHLNVGGSNNTGEVMSFSGRDCLVAHRGGIWLAMIATIPFSKASVGYVGVSDGGTDLAQGFQMDWQFDRAPCGNIVLTGEIDPSHTQEFVLGLAFGESLHRAMAGLGQSLSFPFSEKRDRFIEQWTRADQKREPLEKNSGDDGKLYRTSVRMLLAHEDKLYPGAMVASLAIPWGEAKDDQAGEGGYHLIWTRDMVQCAMGLLAAGNTETPLRALIYLATCQNEDGGFAQNFWVEGDAFWTGSQLDEVAFPILLAHRLWRANGLRSFDPRPMVKKAAGYLLREGPATRQERWEEVSGYSPSTLAVMIAALICAANFARDDGKEEAAVFVEQYADWIEHNLEQWTVTRKGTLVPGITDHFVRIVPSQPGDPLPDGGADDAVLSLSSQPPGMPLAYPAKEIVDGGFLELVRYGIRRPDDPIILNTLKVVDAVLKVETPIGTSWHRYNHDGYGQRDDGGPYEGFGKGRAWPLLTGERGHYEVAAGRDASSYIRWMEGLATPTFLIPEQCWDEPDRPESGLRFGRPTGSATPLLWAHAEYIRLLRSARDGRVFDLIPEVAERYIQKRPGDPLIQYWTFAAPATRIGRGHTLRIMAKADFELKYSLDSWSQVETCKAVTTSVGIYFADIRVPNEQGTPLSFTFLWPDSQQWENRNFSVEMTEPAQR